MRIGLGMKLGVSLVLLSGAIVTAGTIAVSAARKGTAQVEEVVRANAASDALRAFHTDLTRLIAYAQLAATGDPTFVELLDQQRRVVDEDATRVRQLAEDGTPLTAGVMLAGEQWAAYRMTLNEEDALALQGTLETLRNQADNAVRGQGREALDWTQTFARRQAGPIALALGLATLGVGLMWFGIVQPLGRLAKFAQALARGDLSHRVARLPNDELGDVAQILQKMADHVQRARTLPDQTSVLEQS